MQNPFQVQAALLAGCCSAARPSLDCFQRATDYRSKCKGALGLQYQF